MKECRGFRMPGQRFGPMLAMREAGRLGNRPRAASVKVLVDTLQTLAHSAANRARLTSSCPFTGAGTVRDAIERAELQGAERLFQRWVRDRCCYDPAFLGVIDQIVIGPGVLLACFVQGAPVGRTLSCSPEFVGPRIAFTHGIAPTKRMDGSATLPLSVAINIDGHPQAQVGLMIDRWMANRSYPQ